MLKKYTIAGEQNPVWQLVEPVILKAWAEGMCNASYKRLYLIHFLALLLSTATFLAGFVLRIAVVVVVLFLAYSMFEESLTLAFVTVFPSFDDGVAAPNTVGQPTLWVYQLLGYVILIKSIMFVFGRNFAEWLLEAAAYVLIMVTGMGPLKWIARGLLSERFMAQYLAKTSFMGMHMAQTIAAAPPEIRNRYDRIFDLYLKSNREDARHELEQICASS